MLIVNNAFFHQPYLGKSTFVHILQIFGKSETRPRGIYVGDLGSKAFLLETITYKNVGILLALWGSTFFVLNLSFSWKVCFLRNDADSL